MNKSMDKLGLSLKKVKAVIRESVETVMQPLISEATLSVRQPSPCFDPARKRNAGMPLEAIGWVKISNETTSTSRNDGTRTAGGERPGGEVGPR